MGHNTCMVATEQAKQGICMFIFPDGELAKKYRIMFSHGEFTSNTLKFFELGGKPSNGMKFM